MSVNVLTNCSNFTLENISFVRQLHYKCVQHISTIYLRTAALRDAWWNTVIEGFGISLSTDICGLCHISRYLFLLGSRLLSVTVSYHNERNLHIINFRFLRDTAAWYYRHLPYQKIREICSRKEMQCIYLIFRIYLLGFTLSFMCYTYDLY